MGKIFVFILSSVVLSLKLIYYSCPTCPKQVPVTYRLSSFLMHTYCTVLKGLHYANKHTLIHITPFPAKFWWIKCFCARVCTDVGYTHCTPRSCLRSIVGGRGSHRSAQCMEANLCHCSCDPSALRHQGVKFKLLLQPANSIIWGKDMSLWHILAVFPV